LHLIEELSKDDPKPSTSKEVWDNISLRFFKISIVNRRSDLNLTLFNVLQNIKIVYQISDKEILTEAKKYLSSPIINSNKTSKEITNEILSIAKNSINKSETIYGLCKNIKESIDSIFDGNWECNAFYNNIGSYYILLSSSFDVKIKFGNLLINVWKVKDYVSIY
jgi:hypothetical protein